MPTATLSSSSRRSAPAVGAEFTIVTLAPDETGVHVEAATDASLSKKLEGRHFDDAICARETIRTETAGQNVGTLRFRLLGRSLDNVS